MKFLNRLLLGSALALAAAAPAAAQRAAAPVESPGAMTEMPQISGKTVDGAPFQLAALKGKVVLVMFWSTSCAVCRDKMPELRTNYEGWAGKPFELVAVSVDTRMQDLRDYERIISISIPLKQRFIQLWAGDAGYQDNLGKHTSLPAAYLLDKSGKVVACYTGRIPAEAWDKIADLL